MDAFNHEINIIFELGARKILEIDMYEGFLSFLDFLPPPSPSETKITFLTKLKLMKKNFIDGQNQFQILKNIGNAEVK